MKDWLSAAAASRPDGTSVVLPDGNVVTYMQLQRLCVAQAFSLSASGVQRGDHIAVLMENSLSYVVLTHAIMRLGAVLIPLNVRLNNEELAYQLNAAGARFLCFDEHYRQIAELLQHSNLRLIRVSSVAEIAPENAKYASAEIDLDAVCAIVFTSGTSGKPKGAQLTYSNFFYSAMASAYRLGVLPHDRWLICLPIFHVGGLSIVYRSCLYNTAAVLYEDSFDPLRIVKQTQRDQATMLSVVPTQLYRLLQVDDGSLAHLRVILLGGASAAPELLVQAKEHHLNIATTYGLTEAASQIATTLPDQAYAKPGSVGHPLPFTSVQIVDDDGKPLSSGEIGEIAIYGPTIMRGYLGFAEIGQGEGFNTGDIGYLDADGDLYILQRRSDLIISGGENVYPAEVENVIRTHPDIADAVVVGLPDAEWGQQVAAAIICKPNNAVTPEEIAAFCADKLARYKCPRTYRFFDAFPLTASGKVDHRAIVQLFST